MNISRHTKGLIITATGILVISPDGLLTRLIHADTLTILFWRSLFYCFGMLLLLSLWYRSKIVDAFFNIGVPGLFMALLYLCGSMGFIYSVTHTAVANTLLILSTTPLWAALITWLVFREKIATKTWVAIVVVGLGVAIICSAKSVMPDAQVGNLAGLCAAMALATSFVLVERNRNKDLLPSFVLGGLMTALILASFVAPTQTSNSDLIYLFLMGFIILPIGTGMMFFGPKLISAPETSLLLLLESIFGPVWVWLVLNEYPGHIVLLGGGLILVTLVIHAVLSIKAGDKNRQPDNLP